MIGDGVRARRGGANRCGRVTVMRVKRSGTPVLFVSHSVLTEVECPPKERSGLRHYVAVSPEVKDHLVRTQGIEPTRVSVVDTDLFSPGPPLDLAHGLKVLVLSNNPFPLSILAEAVDLLPELRPQVTLVGRCSEYWKDTWGNRPGFNLQDPLLATPALYHRHHLIFTLGRGVLEAMSCAPTGRRHPLDLPERQCATPGR